MYLRRPSKTSNQTAGSEKAEIMCMVISIRNKEIVRPGVMGVNSEQNEKSWLFKPKGSDIR